MSDEVHSLTVRLKGDVGGLESAFRTLPDLAQKGAREAQQRIQAEIARTKLAMKSSLAAGTYAGGKEYVQGLATQRELGTKLGLVEGALARGTISLDRYEAANKKVASASKNLGNELGGLTKDSRKAGYTFMMLAQLADDAQYGFKSIVNNIPGVAMAAGASMKLAGTLAVTAVAVNQVINNWDSLRNAFGDTTGFKYAEYGINEIYKGLLSVIGLTPQMLESKKVFGAGWKVREKELTTAAKLIGNVPTEAGALLAASMQKAVVKAGGDKAIIEEIYDKFYKKGEEFVKKPTARTPFETPEERARRETTDVEAYKTRIKGSLRLVLTEAMTTGKIGAVTELVSKSPKLAEKMVIEAGKAEREKFLAENSEFEGLIKSRQNTVMQERNRTIEQTTRAMEAGPVGRMLLLNPQADVGKQIASELALTGAKYRDKFKVGEGEDLGTKVGEKIREQMAEAIAERAAERGISPEAARAQLLRENTEKSARAMIEARGPIFQAMWGTGEELQKKFQADILSGKGEIQKEQLDELRKAVAALDKVDTQTKAIVDEVKKGIVGRVGPKR